MSWCSPVCGITPFVDAILRKTRGTSSHSAQYNCVARRWRSLSRLADLVSFQSIAPFDYFKFASDCVVNRNDGVDLEYK